MTLNDKPDSLIMKPKHYDLIVIGAGPGGEGAAMQAVKACKSVAVVEDQQYVGGNCTHWGTIPSKSLRQTIEDYTRLKKHPLFQTVTNQLEVSYSQLLKRAEQVIE